MMTALFRIFCGEQLRRKSDEGGLLQSMVGGADRRFFSSTWDAHFCSNLERATLPITHHLLLA